MADFIVDPSENEKLPRASPTSPSSVQSVTAFARFEFEPGKGNEGTKVLMVEWEDEDVTRNTAGSWQVAWSGKSTQLHADDRPADNIRRLYFLLPPGQTIPPSVTLTYEPPPDSGATAKKPHQLTVNPLPAIFPPELGQVGRQEGKKGVLHTIWAKQRLRVLENEIRQEEEFNLEGIALEMALQERDWIQENFGVSGQRPALGSGRSSGSVLASPRTPGGSRLNEKLRGLSLNTKDDSLHKAGEVNTPSHDFNPLSPETQDVAVSFFDSMGSQAAPLAASNKGLSQSMITASPQGASKTAASRYVPILPPTELSRQRSSDSATDLFAKAISPRTPAVGKSPFSFSAAEVMPYLSKGGC